MPDSPHLLVIGAHPDDCDFACGGTAILAAQSGARVRFVSVTNGDRGHMAPAYAADRNRLAVRRDAEARRAVATFGGDYRCLGVPDGEVYVTPDLTECMVREIRSWGPPGRGPDLVLLNRPNDYHRDHRYTAQLVLDATYLLTVPFMCPDVPHLQRMPVFAYWWDRFREGGAFRPDFVAPIDDVMDAKVQLALAHESQIFEWLPYNSGRMAEVPTDAADRAALAREWLQTRGARVAAACPDRLPPGYRLAEAFQVSEYGRTPEPGELERLVPGLGSAKVGGRS